MNVTSGPDAICLKRERVSFIADFPEPQRPRKESKNGGSGHKIEEVLRYPLTLSSPAYWKRWERKRGGT